MSEPRPTHHDDLELARAALSGDAGARRRFATRMRCVPRMLKVVCRRLEVPFPREDLEDLVQDTVTTIWRRLDSYQGMASLETWAYRFCRFELANRRRARGRRPKHVSVEGWDTPAEPEDAVLEYDHVHRALDGLEPEESVLIRLKHYEGLSFDEIARHLGLPSSTLKSRYYRGMERLRTQLSPTEREVGL